MTTRRPKNPAAVALGRKGGQRSAETGASMRNGFRGGRPRLTRPCLRCGAATTYRDSGGRAKCAEHGGSN